MKSNPMRKQLAPKLPILPVGPVLSKYQTGAIVADEAQSPDDLNWSGGVGLIWPNQGI